jgi:hypothetical protein
MDLQAIEKRLKILEDLEEIRSLHYRYVNCLSEGKWDIIGNCFAENAVVEVHKGARGRDNIHLLFKDDIAKAHRGSRHANCLVHPLIVVEGDRARGEWILFEQHSDPHVEHGLSWTQGPYDMEYIRENGEWKINLLKWRPNIGC